MDDAAKLGELLKLPNLEEETITMINFAMRKIIGDYTPLSQSQKDEVTSLVAEWFNGATEGGA